MLLTLTDPVHLISIAAPPLGGFDLCAGVLLIRDEAMNLDLKISAATD
jgi:hypothetical protein